MGPMDYSTNQDKPDRLSHCYRPDAIGYFLESFALLSPLTERGLGWRFTPYHRKPGLWYGVHFTIAWLLGIVTLSQKGP